MELCSTRNASAVMSNEEIDVRAGARDAARADTVIVDGCAISYRSLGSPEDPTLLLIHGGAAHSGWWSRIAPGLAERWHVVLADLSGHGDSGHREAYTGVTWAAEMAAVLYAVGARSAVAVGHSMGGLVAVATAARAPELVDRLVLVDSRLPLRGLPLIKQVPRFYPTAEEVLGRFRLMPDRTAADPDLLRELAVSGLVETAEGWRWKFDPRARRRLTNEDVAADLAALTCPVGYVYGAGSDMGGAASLAHLEQLLGRSVPTAVVAGAFHHLPLDQPNRCAEAIERLLLEIGE